jgi:lysophospholipase L1-like esterase
MSLYRLRLLSGVLASVGLVLATFLFVSPPPVQGKSPALGINGQGTLFIVGDSLTVGTEAFGSLTTKVDALGTWTNVVMDAKVGRKASLGATVIDKGLTSTTTALVIALGTNDMISKPETWYPRWVIDEVMRKTRGLPVLWINVEFSSTGRGDWRARGVRFNKELRSAKLRYPNLTIADWNTAFTPKSASRFVADGVHLTVSGYRTRSQFMVSAIGTFGRAVVDATTTTTTTSTTSTSTSTTSSTTTLPPTTTSTSSTTSPSTSPSTSPTTSIAP